MRAWERIWLGATIALMVLATLAVFLYAPREAKMGEVQRIFYSHVHHVFHTGRAQREPVTIAMVSSTSPPSTAAWLS